MTGKPTLVFDGDLITRNGKPYAFSAVEQSRACTKWLQELLIELTGQKFPVRSVLLFPGWFVEAKSTGQNGQTWVLSPKTLKGFIAKRPAQLREDQVRMAY